MGFCDVCQKDFAHLFEHRRLHDQSSKFHCTFNGCSKSYASKTSLEQHIRVTHTKEKPFQCHYCETRFPTTYQRTLHHRTHTQEKKYECAICGSLFPSYSQHKMHQFSHSDERFYCLFPGCSKDYSRPYSLNAHYKKTHTEGVRSDS